MPTGNIHHVTSRQPFSRKTTRNRHHSSRSSASLPSAIEREKSPLESSPPDKEDPRNNVCIARVWLCYTSVSIWKSPRAVVAAALFTRHGRRVSHATLIYQALFFIPKLERKKEAVADNAGGIYIFGEREREKSLVYTRGNDVCGRGEKLTRAALGNFPIDAVYTGENRSRSQK